MYEKTTTAKVYPKIVENVFSVEQELDFLTCLGDYFLRDTTVKKELSRRTLRVLLTLADQREAIGLKARQAALQGQEERLSGLRTYSPRAFRDCLQELEKEAYIQRAGSRLPGNRGIEIRFLPKLLQLTKTLKYSLGKAQLKLVFEQDEKQGRIPNHFVADRQNLPPLKGRRESKPDLRPTTVKLPESARAQEQNIIELSSRAPKPPKVEPDTRVKPQNSPNGKSSKPSYGQILKFEALNSSPGSKPKRQNPVLWSILYVASQKNLAAKKQQAVAARAWLEINAPDLLAPSSVDWSYWGSKWPEFRFDAREFYAGDLLEELLRPGPGPGSGQNILEELASQEEAELAGQEAELAGQEEALERLQKAVDSGEMSQEDALIILQLHQEAARRRA